MYHILFVSALLAVSFAQEPIQSSDVCSNVRSFRNDKDLYPDPSDCHFYYQCFYHNETHATGLRRKCSDNMFWHDSILQCLPEGSKPCTDLCLDDAIAAKGCYAGTGCRQYFKCANTASYSMCCPKGTRFNSETCGCDSGSECSEECGQIAWTTTSLPPVTQVSETTCKDSYGTSMSIVSGQPGFYYTLDQFGTQSAKMPCPATTVFSLVTCQCESESTVTLPPLQPKRQAVFWAPFDFDTNDHSQSKFSTFLYAGATREGKTFAQGSGSLKLSGKGYLSIPGMKTFDLQNSASFCSFFKCEDSTCSKGAILSNYKQDTKDFTVSMATDSTNTLTARLDFWQPLQVKTVNAKIQTPAHGWNHVCLTYDGNTISLYLNGDVAATETVTGFLSISHAPYLLGFDQALGYFSGYIDDVLVTPFAMTKQEVLAHFKGDIAYLNERGFGLVTAPAPVLAANPREPKLRIPSRDQHFKRDSGESKEADD